jgi:hypothetical protein
MEMLFGRLSRQATPTLSNVRPAIARMSVDSLAKEVPRVLVLLSLRGDAIR